MNYDKLALAMVQVQESISLESEISNFNKIIESVNILNENGLLLEKLDINQLKEKAKEIINKIIQKAKDIIKWIKEKVLSIIKKIKEKFKEKKNLKQEFNNLKQSIKESVSRDELQEFLQQDCGFNIRLMEEILNILDAWWTSSVSANNINVRINRNYTVGENDCEPSNDYDNNLPLRLYVDEVTNNSNSMEVFLNKFGDKDIDDIIHCNEKEIGNIIAILQDNIKKLESELSHVDSYDISDLSSLMKAAKDSQTISMTELENSSKIAELKALIVADEKYLAYALKFYSLLSKAYIKCNMFIEKSKS